MKIILLLLITIVSQNVNADAKGTWLDYAEIYMGIDATIYPSPLCFWDENNYRATSNMGLKLNVFSSANKRFQAGIKYTHHSCIFSTDAYAYDAVGFELVYRFYSK